MKKRWLLSNLRKIYDGKSASKGSVRSAVDILVEGGTVAQVRPHLRGRKIPADIGVVDASRLYLTPGLIDCHSHVTLDGLTPSDLQRANGPAGLLYAAKNLYRSLVDGGVTTLRDMGGAAHFHKRLIEEGAWIGPRLELAVCMLCASGGHGDRGSKDRRQGEHSILFPPASGRPSSIVDGPWECRKRVREIESVGGDFIKICAGRGFSFRAPGKDPYGGLDFTAEELAALCGEAARRGMRVACHAHGSRGIAAAVRAGVQDLQHVTYLGEAEAELAAKHGCTVTPTSWAVRSFLEGPAFTSGAAEKARILEAHARAVQLARGVGLPILVGSDACGADMHGKNYTEMSRLVDEGLSVLEAWHGATGLPAKVFGLRGAGVIAPGNRADLLLFNEDVITDPKRFGPSSMVEVVKDGVGHRGGLPIPQNGVQKLLLK